MVEWAGRSLKARAAVGTSLMLVTTAGVELVSSDSANATPSYGSWACGQASVFGVEGRTGVDSLDSPTYFYAYGKVRKVANEGSTAICGHVSEWPGAVNANELELNITAYKGGAVVKQKTSANAGYIPSGTGTPNNVFTDALPVSIAESGHGTWTASSWGRWKDSGNELVRTPTTYGPNGISL